MRLCQTMRRLDIDAIAIAETQINSSLLLNSKVAHDKIVRVEHRVGVIEKNYNELIVRSQQGGALLSIRSDLSKCSSTTGTHETGL